jgi:hypothetical protein
MSTNKIKTDNATDDPGQVLPLPQIQIDAVFDRDHVRMTSPLVGCFFSPQGSGAEYMLFGQQGTMVKQQIRNDETFTLEFAGLLFDLTVRVNKGNNRAEGTWQAHVKGESGDKGKGRDVDGDGGTYTAQAGGGVPSAASASA